MNTYAHYFEDHPVYQELKKYDKDVTGEKIDIQSNVLEESLKDDGHKEKSKPPLVIIKILLSIKSIIGTLLLYLVFSFQYFINVNNEDIENLNKVLIISKSQSNAKLTKIINEFLLIGKCLENGVNPIQNQQNNKSIKRCEELIIYKSYVSIIRNLLENSLQSIAGFYSLAEKILGLLGLRFLLDKKESYFPTTNLFKDVNQKQNLDVLEIIDILNELHTQKICQIDLTTHSINKYSLYEKKLGYFQKWKFYNSLKQFLEMIDNETKFYEEVFESFQKICRESLSCSSSLSLEKNVNGNSKEEVKVLKKIQILSIINRQIEADEKKYDINLVLKEELQKYLNFVNDELSYFVQKKKNDGLIDNSAVQKNSEQIFGEKFYGNYDDGLNYDTINNKMDDEADIVIYEIDNDGASCSDDDSSYIGDSSDLDNQSHEADDIDPNDIEIAQKALQNNFKTSQGNFQAELQQTMKDRKLDYSNSKTKKIKLQVKKPHAKKQKKRKPKEPQIITTGPQNSDNDNKIVSNQKSQLMSAFLSELTSKKRPTLTKDIIS